MNEDATRTRNDRRRWRTRIRAAIRDVPPAHWLAAILTGFLGSVPLGLMMQ